MANDPIRQRFATWVRNFTAPSAHSRLNIDRDPLPRRIEKLRALYEKSKTKDATLAIREMYKHVHQYFTMELFELLHELARDNLFFIEQLPDFPTRSLTSFEVKEVDTDLQGLTLRLTNEDKIREFFLQGIEQVAELISLITPADTPSPYTVPLYSLSDTNVLTECILQLFLKNFAPDSIRALAFTNTSKQLFSNLCAVSKIAEHEVPKYPHKIVNPTESNFTPEECINRYLSHTPFVEYLSRDCAFSIPDRYRPEHMLVVAGTGSGKTQFIQSDIYTQLQKTERPGIVVIDSQGQMLPKLERLDLWRDDLIIIDPEDAIPPALNMFALPERIKHYNRNIQEQIETKTIELFGFLFAALDQTLTGRQATFFSFITRLVLSIPGASIRTLREVLEEEVPEKKPQQSKFWPYVDKLDEDARAFFTQQFYQKGYNTETRRGIVNRLYGVLRVPAFNRMFTASANRLDLFAELNRGRTVLINTSKSLLGQDASSVFGRFAIAQTLGAVFQRVAIKPPYRPALIYIDEAADYFQDETLANLFAQARKFELGALIAFQNLDQLPAGLRPVVVANTTTKLVSGLSDKDARAISSDMRTNADFLMSMQKKEHGSEWGCFIKTYTPKAIRLFSPFGVIEDADKMSEEEHERLRQRNRERYGTSGSANVSQENSLSQTHEAPAKKPSNEVPPLHPTTVSTTPPPAPNPAPDPHAGIDD